MVGVEEWKAIGDESGGEECAGRNFFSWVRVFSFAWARVPIRCLWSNQILMESGVCIISLEEHMHVPVSFSYLHDFTASFAAHNLKYQV
jgi:hypothetical protein